MTIVLRFVDKNGLIKERFFDLAHVSDTTSSTLKNGIFSILSNQGLDVQNIRGQGYDGASNMRGEWNGLQALVIRDCPYAYYIHCFAHRLQLTLVTASKKVIHVSQFFGQLNLIINVVGASCKRNDELKSAYALELANMIEDHEIETGTGLNQVGNLQRPGDTRWSSHFKSITSLMKMFNAAGVVLDNIIEGGGRGITPHQHGEASLAYNALNSFKFVFILHLMRDVMEITDKLCQALQKKSQDVMNAIDLVSSTKRVLQIKRDSGWDELLSKVKTFCDNHHVEVPEMSASYVLASRRGRPRSQQDQITIEHHYRVDIFMAVIDCQLQELNIRFNENAVELLTLSCSLDPTCGWRYFKIDDVLKLMEKYYPQDFTLSEKEGMKIELLHFEGDIVLRPDRTFSGMSGLCQWLAETKKSEVYPLIYRLVKLILTLPVSTATTERSFSAMKIIKTDLRNKMEDDFLANSLLIYIEKEIAETFIIDSIMDDFRDMKERRVLF